VAHDPSPSTQNPIKLKQLLYEHKNMQLQHYLSNLTPTEATDYSLWKAKNKKIISFQKQNPPIRIEDGTCAKSNEGEATAFAKHLQTVFQPHSSISNDDDNYDFLNTPYLLELPVDKFKVNQITHLINMKLNSRKSTGYNLITARILKELRISALRFLSHLQCCIKNWPFPVSMESSYNYFNSEAW
jgi:hypothetical protein